LTQDGYIAVRIIPDSVDSAEFFNFIVQEVVSETLAAFAVLLIIHPATLDEPISW